MRRTEHIVDRHGLVGCPIRGDVPVLDCAGCTAVEAVVAGDPMLVLCRPETVHMAARRRRTPSPWMRFFAPGR